MSGGLLYALVALLVVAVVLVGYLAYLWRRGSLARDALSPRKDRVSGRDVDNAGPHDSTSASSKLE